MEEFLIYSHPTAEQHNYLRVACAQNPQMYFEHLTFFQE